MELKVYNGERFERSKLWYFVVALIILAVVILSICASNIGGGILVLVFAGGYFFYSAKFNTDTHMKIGKNALQIGQSTFPRNTFYGFVLEYHTEKNRIHNIVLLEQNKSPRIYTITDSQANLQRFVDELTDYLPMLDKYDQGFVDKLIRKIKL